MPTRFFKVRHIILIRKQLTNNVSPAFREKGLPLTCVPGLFLTGGKLDRCFGNRPFFRWSRTNVSLGLKIVLNLL